MQIKKVLLKECIIIRATETENLEEKMKIINRFSHGRIRKSKRHRVEAGAMRLGRRSPHSSTPTPTVSDKYQFMDFKFSLNL